MAGSGRHLVVRRTWWRLVLAMGGVGGAACARLPQWLAPSRVEMQAWLVDSVLTPQDTLRIRRVIRNNGPRPIWMSWTTTDVSFVVRDTSGRAACTYNGVYLLGQIVVRVAPHAEATHHVNWPLAYLSDCGPGVYVVDVSDGYATGERGTGRGGALRVPVLPLTVRPTSRP